MTKEGMSVSKLYLLLYNSLCMFGWFYLWVIQYKYYTSPVPADFWSMVKPTLNIVQTAAVLEIVHSMLRLVRSPVMTTALQVFSRVMVLWGYANISENSQQSFGIKLMIMSWSLVEVPRYLFYIVKLVDMPMPDWLLFLRYNLFYVLYPTGISGEIWVIMKALKFIKESQTYSVALPNAWNIAIDFYGISVFLLILYIPIGPFMIKNMINQRKKNWVDARKVKSE